MAAVLTTIEEALGLPSLSKTLFTPPALAQVVRPLAALTIENPYGLPTLGGHIPHRPSPIQDSHNPGVSSPQRQQQFQRPMMVDQTMSVTLSKSGIPQQSDGQPQMPDFNPGARGVTITAGYGSVVHSSGNAQLPALHRLDQGVQSHVHIAPGSVSPLPPTVSADSQSSVRKIVPQRQQGPLTVNVHAGQTHGGEGLPRSVHIKG